MPKPFSLIYSIKCHILFLVVKFSVFHSVYTKLARTQVNNVLCVCVCVCVCIFQPECIYYAAIYCHLVNFWDNLHIIMTEKCALKCVHIWSSTIFRIRTILKGKNRRVGRFLHALGVITHALFKGQLCHTYVKGHTYIYTYIHTMTLLCYLWFMLERPLAKGIPWNHLTAPLLQGDRSPQEGHYRVKKAHSS